MLRTQRIQAKERDRERQRRARILFGVLDGEDHVDARFEIVRMVVTRRGIVGTRQTSCGREQPSSTRSTCSSRSLAAYERVRLFTTFVLLRKRHLRPSRLPLSVMNQLADRPIQSYWATRPFNKTTSTQTDKQHRSELNSAHFDRCFRSLVLTLSRLAPSQ